MRLCRLKQTQYLSDSIRREPDWIQIFKTIGQRRRQRQKVRLRLQAFQGKTLQKGRPLHQNPPARNRCLNDATNLPSVRL
jgi:hypothetical protein